MLSVFSQKKKVTKKGFVIKGSIVGIPDGTPVLIKNTEDNSVLARDTIRSYKFTIKGSVPEPDMYWLTVGSEQPQYLYLENSNITVSGNKSALKDLKITGSASHNDYLDFKNTFNPLVVRLNNVVNQVNMTPDGQTRDSLMGIYSSIIEDVQSGVDSFVDHKKGSYVTPFMLSVTSQFYDDPLLLEKRFNRLDSVIRFSKAGTALKSFIDYNKIGAIGTDAIDFTQPDTTGTPVSLSSFKGKYVLVDFWASWCQPCRMENPNVVANYNKFHDKNFTVLGVSLDRPGQKQAWINAIEKDHLTWTHVSDLQFWNNAAAQLYRVQGIPFNILVNPDGVIVGKNLRGPDLESKLCELLGCN